MIDRPFEYRVIGSAMSRARLVMPGSSVGDSPAKAILTMEVYVGTRDVGVWQPVDTVDVILNTQDYSRHEIESCMTRITRLELENKVLKGMLEKR